MIRAGDTAYLDTWRSGDLGMDFIVSSEFETANAIARLVGVPGARTTDFFWTVRFRCCNSTCRGDRLSCSGDFR